MFPNSTEIQLEVGEDDWRETAMVQFQQKLILEFKDELLEEVSSLATRVSRLIWFDPVYKLMILLVWPCWSYGNKYSNHYIYYDFEFYKSSNDPEWFTVRFNKIL
jgi:hypothetical protein